MENPTYEETKQCPSVDSEDAKEVEFDFTLPVGTN
jgi:hypothetical protein